ncbi:hypothetical protein WR25_15070 [Diploscapter pachys]|uniref:Uncharacterized protein n=1 Tax=Diploscapter pachys TaxID=2018661 RepID=A0A2A2JWW7_9BILA|nr:hypothetical protein WR25_15070 [Diploscapter pachys]
MTRTIWGWGRIAGVDGGCGRIPPAFGEGVVSGAYFAETIAVRPLRHAFGAPPPPGGGGLSLLALTRVWGVWRCMRWFVSPPVTPDLVRGPPGRKGMARGSSHPLAAEWTPDQVRGDGVGGAAGDNPIRCRSAIVVFVDVQLAHPALPPGAVDEFADAFAAFAGGGDVAQDELHILRRPVRRGDGDRADIRDLIDDREVDAHVLDPVEFDLVDRFHDEAALHDQPLVGDLIGGGHVLQPADRDDDEADADRAAEDRQPAGEAAEQPAIGARAEAVDGAFGTAARCASTSASKASSAAWERASARSVSMSCVFEARSSHQPAAVVTRTPSIATTGVRVASTRARTASITPALRAGSMAKRRSGVLTNGGIASCNVVSDWPEPCTAPISCTAAYSASSKPYHSCPKKMWPDNSPAIGAAWASIASFIGLWPVAPITAMPPSSAIRSKT